MKIIECPRDAMQGLSQFIPTERKIEYINSILKVGFDTVDFGSFVSPKAIPQMKDTKEVLAGLDMESTRSDLLAIVANTRGAEEAAVFNQIQFLGFPLSISETFQQRNTNKSISEAFDTVKSIQEICIKTQKKLVIYISMGFGNPYGEPYNEAIIEQFIQKLLAIDIKIISLADTIGSATPELITKIFNSIIPLFPNMEIGAHLHTTPTSSLEKITAVFNSGCRRIDGAIGGMGGCPMAKNELVGNLNTITLVEFLKTINQVPDINFAAFEKALYIKSKLFDKN
ncbi:hypothetical protein [Flexithrix dorotheae]|uniref:hypothetical protein n=1 Tax=Flexithrix dorotheae TaxID=70993 RepID=UPI0003764443|nr:hypothetical protein [Flexithrix dorotheae]